MTKQSQRDAGRVGPTSSGFATASAVTGLGEGRYRAELDLRYSVAGKLNGGYLLAVLSRAASAQAAGDPVGGTGAADGAGAQRRGPVQPIAATVHYLSLAQPGPAEVLVTPLRQGRSTSQVRAQLRQVGRVNAEAFFTFGLPAHDAHPGEPGTTGEPRTTGDLRATGASGWSDVPPVELPPEQQCFRMPAHPPEAPFEVSLMEVIDQRLDPAVLTFAGGEPTGAGQMRGWVRIPGEPAVDSAGLMLVADALPPAVFNLGPLGWAPTLSLTVHLTGRAAPGPLRVRQQVHAMDAGVLSQVCDIWDTRGSLVAHATQLAALPR